MEIRASPTGVQLIYIKVLKVKIAVRKLTDKTNLFFKLIFFSVEVSVKEKKNRTKNPDIIYDLDRGVSSHPSVPIKEVRTNPLKTLNDLIIVRVY